MQFQCTVVEISVHVSFLAYYYKRKMLLMFPAHRHRKVEETM